MRMTEGTVTGFPPPLLPAILAYTHSRSALSPYIKAHHAQAPIALSTILFLLLHLSANEISHTPYQNPHSPYKLPVVVYFTSCVSSPVMPRIAHQRFELESDTVKCIFCMGFLRPRTKTLLRNLVAFATLLGLCRIVLLGWKEGWMLRF